MKPILFLVAMYLLLIGFSAGIYVATEFAPACQEVPNG